MAQVDMIFVSGSLCYALARTAHCHATADGHCQLLPLFHSVQVGGTTGGADSGRPVAVSKSTLRPDLYLGDGVSSELQCLKSNGKPSANP